jgi:hypothetical protein
MLTPGYLNRLSPSFNITDNQGYSFVYNNTDVHFKWQDGQFYFDTNKLSRGKIYEFQLEYYGPSRTYDASRSGNIAGKEGPGAFPIEGADRWGNRYIFLGVDPETVSVIPFAATLESGTRVDHTNPELLEKERANTYDYEPYYNTAPIPMPNIFGGNNEDTVKPAAPVADSDGVGMDIRFDLPKMFDEQTGKYDKLAEGFEVELQVPHPDQNYEFIVTLNDPGTLPAFDPADGNSLPPESVTSRRPVTVSDASRLIKTGQTNETADRVRLRVDGLDPSLKYSDAYLTLFAPGNIDKNKIDMRNTSLSGVKFYTFLDYNVTSPLDGKRYLEIIPYNMNTAGGGNNDNSKYGWYLALRTDGRVPPNRDYIESTGQRPIMLPIASSDGRFSYVVNFYLAQPGDSSTPDYISQEIDYTPGPISPEISVPRDFTVGDYKLKPLEAYPGGEVANLTFTPSWEIGKEDNIRKFLADSSNNRLIINYELNLSTKPTDLDIEAFGIYKKIRMVIESSDPSNKNVGLLVTYTDEFGEPLPGNAQKQELKLRRDRLSLEPDEMVYYAEINFDVLAARQSTTTADVQGDISLSEVDFRYPDVYFMNVKSINYEVDPSPDNTDLGMSSDFDFMTLDDITPAEVPPPVNLTVRSGPEEAPPSLDVSYEIPSDALTRYFQNIYDSGRMVMVNLYVGQFEDTIKAAFYEGDERTVTPEERMSRNLSREVLYERFTPFTGEVNLAGYIDVLRGRDQPPATGVVRIAEIPVPVSGNIPGIENYWETNNDAISALSGGNIRTNLKLTGLDENQEYYLFADLTIAKVTTGAALTVEAPSNANTSIISEIVADTTRGTGNILTPEENIPPAPGNIWAPPEEVTEREATVYWDKVMPEENMPANIAIEYEVIRLRSYEMDEETEFKSVEPNFQKFLTGIDKSKEAVGWVTNGNSATMYNSSYAVQPNTDKYTYYPGSMDGDPVSLNDRTLMPNNIYFYYVRTVRVVAATEDGGTGKRLVSSWVRCTVTTELVKAPYDLKILNDRLDYNRLSEIIFQFDAPFVDMDGLGVRYDFYYELREDTGEWTAGQRLTNPLSHERKADLESMRFIYKLTGLKNNTLYWLRVRMYDRATGVYSMYTSPVQFKTDMNQQDYDDLISQDDWLYYLQGLLEDLLNNPYWVAEDTPSQLVAVYRPGDSFTGMLQAASDARIDLYNNGADSVTYYLPASSVKTANAAEKGFRSQYPDMDILMSPRMLNERDNAAMYAMDDFLKNKGISDYFIRVTVNRSDINELINEYPPLTKQTRVALEAVGTVPGVGSIAEWDASLFKNFAEIVDSRINDSNLRKSFLERVKSGDINNEEMVEYIESIVRSVKDELMRSVNRQLDTGGQGILSSRTELFTQLDAPMYLETKAVSETTYVNGFQSQSGHWVAQNVFDHLSGKAMVTQTPGTFIFAGNAVNIPGIDTVPQGGTISTFTAKYGLEDYLGGAGVDLNQNATRQMVAGCVARLAGAPKAAEPIGWISSNLNTSLSSRNAGGNVQVQEAASMIMALYEKKTGTAIDKMTIRNQSATHNMTGLDDRYTQAVRAALETGILSDADISPDGEINIRSLLDMLARLESKVKF